MAVPQGSQAQFAVDAVAPVDSSSEPYEFISETMSLQAEILDTSGIRGTRQHASERTRDGINQVGGQVTMIADPDMLDAWFPRILGTAESSDAFNFAELLPDFLMLFDRVGDVYLYTGCKVAKATFRGTKNGFLELVLDIIGKDETTGQSFPSLTLPVTTNTAPYVFTDGVITLVSSAREITSFELVIDNLVVPEHHNSVNATSVDATDQLITLNCVVDNSTANQDLYEQALLGTTGTLVFTNGTVSTTFTFGKLQSTDKSPNVGGKGRIELPLAMTARKVGTTDALAVTHDSVV